MFEDAGKRAANEMTVWGENRFHFMQVPRKKKLWRLVFICSNNNTVR